MSDSKFPTLWEVPDEQKEWGLVEAIEEQNMIGWNNFFKGRISKQFGVVQMEAYANSDREIPTHYSATWWTAGLIKQVLYFSLNMWQH